MTTSTDATSEPHHTLVDAASLREIADAPDAAAVVDLVLGNVDVGARPELFVIDHASDRLVEVDLDVEHPAEVALGGDLRAALLDGRSHRDGERLWTPVAERDEAVFVLRTRVGDGAASGGRAESSVLGALLRGHRGRFEDLERNRRRADMSVAAELQWDLLPGRADLFGDVRVAGVLEPAYDVAGDVFDYAHDGTDVWVYSFDGMGHGLDATVSGVLTLAATRNVRRRGGSLDEQMEAASRLLFERFGGDRFVTGAAARIGADSVDLVNAGHEPVRVVADGRLDRLDLPAQLPLGVEPDVGYEVRSRPPLGPGGGLVMLSDGSSIASSPSGDSFGQDRVDASIAEHWTARSPLRTGQDVVADILGHVGEGDLGDDVTIVVCRRQDPGP